MKGFIMVYKKFRKNSYIKCLNNVYKTPRRVLFAKILLSFFRLGFSFGVLEFQMALRILVYQQEIPMLKSQVRLG